jgi:hypothetical protein
MNASDEANRPTQHARAVHARAQGRKVWVELEDAREVDFPAVNYRPLRNAGDEDLANVLIEARGEALCWEELDQQLSVHGLLADRWMR